MQIVLVNRFLSFFFILFTTTTVAMTSENKNDLVDLKSVDKDIIVDLWLSRIDHPDNYTGEKLYPSNRAFMCKQAAVALAKVQKEIFTPMGLHLFIYDAYRPYAVQLRLWEFCSDPQYVADPKKGSKHNRGAAVDLWLARIKNEGGKEVYEVLPKPTGKKGYGSHCHRDYTTMEIEEGKIVCRLLELAMEKNGFKGLPSERWHFDFGDEALYEKLAILDIPLNKLKS